MKRIYIALALAGLIGCAVLVDVTISGVAIGNGNGADAENGNGFVKSLGKWIRNRVMNRWNNNNEYSYGNMLRNRWQHAVGNYLNTTRLEGVFSYVDGVYTVDGVELYVGNEWFLDSIARSDYNGDGIYEYMWQELEGLIGTEVVVNGVLSDDALYVSHINGIWLRMPRQADIAELEGTLENINGSYFVDGTELIIKKRGYTKSDIDGDGTLERTMEELDGLVGEEITVDGTVTDDGRILVVHINGIWIL